MKQTPKWVAMCGIILAYSSVLIYGYITFSYDVPLAMLVSFLLLGIMIGVVSTTYYFEERWGKS